MSVAETVHYTYCTSSASLRTLQPSHRPWNHAQQEYQCHRSSTSPRRALWTLETRYSRILTSKAASSSIKFPQKAALVHWYMHRVRGIRLARGAARELLFSQPVTLHTSVGEPVTGESRCYAVRLGNRFATPKAPDMSLMRFGVT
ncbi:hypothetical protein M758_8G178300 [Ceratodon purpureus]|nr:hypothetical protein M758_8G178300 [Ceratodon purpureus]